MRTQWLPTYQRSQARGGLVLDPVRPLITLAVPSSRLPGNVSCRDPRRRPRNEVAAPRLADLAARCLQLDLHREAPAESTPFRLVEFNPRCRCPRAIGGCVLKGKTRSPPSAPGGRVALGGYS